MKLDRLFVDYNIIEIFNYSVILSQLFSRGNKGEWGKGM